MVDEQQEESPQLRLQDIPLAFADDTAPEKAQKIRLDCAKPVKSGDGKYGTWNLWFGYVVNTKVYWGRYPKQKIEEGYTGKVLFFPTEKLSDALEKLANGNIDVEVLIRKVGEENKQGRIIKKYTTEKLSDGRPDESSSSTPTETKFLGDVTEIAQEGIDITEEIFIRASQDGKYDGKITIQKAKEMYAKWKTRF